MLGWIGTYFEASDDVDIVDFDAVLDELDAKDECDAAVKCDHYPEES